jgi:putative Ca2+/H+ antiporter (TMEM165/GDT1 family)
MQKTLFWATFLTVFLAEVGDKTQLAAMTATARTGAVGVVFLAASAALVCATAVGVTVGAALFRVLPESVIRMASGMVFILMGCWMVWKG